MSDAVREFVANAPGDIDAERTTPAADPTFAGHMGRRDIAELLLAHGAPIDIFVAAMLGYLAVVKAMLETHPETRDALGPHGIPLRSHAEAGGELAAEVLAFLDA